MEIPNDMNKDLKKLCTSLLELHHWCRSYTKEKYNRINPFYEDLFDWSERGSYWPQENKEITIYNSATVIGDVNIGEHTWIGPFCLLDGGGGLTIEEKQGVASKLFTNDTSIHF